MQNVLSLRSLCHIMKALRSHMLTAVQHYDEFVQQCVCAAQGNGLVLLSSMLAICNNTLTQFGTAFMPIARSRHF